MESLWGRLLEMPKAYDFINKIYILKFYIYSFKKSHNYK